MEQLIDLPAIQTVLQALRDWVFREVLVVSTLVQLVVVAATFVVARMAANGFRRFVAREIDRRQLVGSLRKIAEAATLFPLPTVWLILLWIATAAAAYSPWPSHLLRSGASLLSLWIVIRLISSVVRNPALSRFLALTAFVLAALNVLKLLDPTIALLDRATFTLGDLELSALIVIKAVISLGLLLWGAVVVSEMAERRLQRSANLAPSVRVLLGKLLKITLYLTAILMALGYVGIDLTAFAVFTGAVGVGIGFGLQKVVSNLVSGFILLLDKSIKPGDLIEIEGGDIGWIASLGARYVSIDTRTGREILVPNEDLITRRVINLSFSNNLLQVETTFVVDRGADLRRAMALCLEAAAATPRVLRVPAPTCTVNRITDLGVELALGFWIDDPHNGIGNVRGAVLLGVLDRLRAQGIAFPATAPGRPGQSP